MTTTWAARASCRGMDRELFFPMGTSSPRPAMAACARCPVRENCLDEALTNGLRGIWGGTTEAHRRRLRAGGRTPIDRTDRETTPMSEDENTEDETAEAAEIVQDLLAGTTVEVTADTYAWPRERVLALINSKRAWRLDTDTDTVVIGSSHDDETADDEPAVDLRLEAKTIVPPAAADDAWDDRPAREDAPDLSNLELLLRRGENSEIPATRKAAEKARTAVEDLRQRVRTEEAETQIRDQIAALEKEMAAAQQKLREIRPNKTAHDGPSTKDVRTWAANHGVECPARGRIPQAVMEKYSQAHESAGV